MADVELKGFAYETTRPVLGSFLNLAEARKITKSENETATFSGDFELDEVKDADEITRFRALCMDAAKELFPNGVPDEDTGGVMSIADAIKAGKFKMPLQSGERLANKAKAKSEASGKERLREWSRGKQVITSRSKDEYPPQVAYHENGKFVYIEDPAALKAAQGKRFYTGAMVLLACRLKAYKGVGANGLPGVKAYLEGVIATGGGEKLIANTKDLQSRFSGYKGINTEDDGGAGSDAEW